MHDMHHKLGRTTLAASLSALLMAAPAAFAQQDQANQNADQSQTTQTAPPSGQGAVDAQADTEAANREDAAGDVEEEGADAGQDGAQEQPANPNEANPESAGQSDAEQSGAAGRDAADVEPSQTEAAPTTDTTHGGGATTASPGTSGGAEMPQAATPQGQDLSDIASSGVQNQQGGTIMLDIEGYSQAIYERGYRQGYLRGIADARERFMVEMEQRMRAQHERMGQQDSTQQPLSQQERMEQPQGLAAQQGDMPARSMTGERGSIIVLPPGVTAEMLIEQMMRANEEGQRGN
ncbi:prolipoprotein diacylglyceryl transferase [Roseitranquillus sediminis]|uniref:hypothetical protein n=1 Tax=Roseitranquillus sediminis TaxID=2809051 RepID=UPI001D0C2BA8|nr:hypothetical protein [Roseitranquillus sediminis]MBM9594620.1 hypothetical protein [Roseitranquillus sediminis]